INTVPELPPQHESTYKGMFAPDGSLIKKNTTNENKNTKQIEINQIFYQNQLRRKDEKLRDIRKAGIRAADGPITYDDYDFYSDKKYMSNHEESMIVANLLRKNIPYSKNSVKMLSAKPINGDKVIPVRATKQTSENESTTELSTWQKYKNGSLDRTTIQPNNHFVVRDRNTDSNKTVTLSIVKSKLAPHAISLPEERDKFKLQQYGTVAESPMLKISSKSSISNESHEK
ncbi:hypothetical protein LOAG_13704, partial [Loa loa]